MTAPSADVGTILESRTVGPVTRTDLVRYAGASGDFNALHHDDEAARAAGFPSVFAMGMYQAGLLAEFAVDHFGAQNLRRYAVRFKDQVWPGDMLTLDGAVTNVTEDAGQRLVEIELTCRRQTGVVVVAASAAFAAP